MKKIIVGFVVIAMSLGCIVASAQKEAKPNPEAEAKRRAFLEAAMASVPQDGEDKTLSPYFFVMGDDDSTDRMPMKSTRADVDIAGVIADVKVTQVYKNEGTKTLEAIYIFPASTRAAVYAMKMKVGKRVIKAEIKEREQARKDYEKARSEGKTASLLEQHRPNVFQMNVANILPGDEIAVELKYTELLVPEDNVYEFVYPTVVGPRYSNVKEKESSPLLQWIKNPFLHAGKKAPYTFGIDVNVNTGIPIAKLASPSHDVKAEYAGKSRAHITVPPSKDAGNRDFVLKYSLAGDAIQSGSLLYKGTDENFFLVMMEPPKRVEKAKIVPREYIFIVDISGSMHGFPLDVTKKLMRDLFAKLTPKDYFNVMLFAGGNAVLSEKSLPATEENIEKAVGVIARQRGGGGTELIPALKRALVLPRTEGTSRIVVAVTDGYVSVEKDAFELIRSNLGKANLFSFGIGSSVNRYIIEGMARAGLGEPFVILNQGEAGGTAEKFREYIQSPILQGIEVSFKGVGAYDVEPKAVPDLFAKRPLIVFGKYRGDPTGEVVVTGSTPGGAFKKAMKLTPAMQSKDNVALRYLWARQRIADLADMNRLDTSDERVKEITRLGLKYNLMTEYTSFVAVDKVVRADGTVVTVKQPLPLPQGVSDYAVGDMAMGAGMMKRGMAAPMALPVSPAKQEAEAGPVRPPKPPQKLVRVDRVTITEGDTSKVNAARIKMALKLAKIRPCYAAVLKLDPSIAGTMKIVIEVDASGAVTTATVVKNGTGDRALEACVAKAIKRHRLPPPVKGAPLTATVVLSFSP